MSTIQKIAVPDVIGIRGDLALEKLKDHGLSAEFVDSVDDKMVLVPSNWIVQTQSIEPATLVESGTEILLGVSKVPKPGKTKSDIRTTLPDLTGTSAFFAIGALEDRGLLVELVDGDGRVVSIAPGLIVHNQSIEAGSIVEAGALIALTVSTTPVAARSSESAYRPPDAPVDGTWNEGGSAYASGFGQWSDSPYRGNAFDFMIDAPPLVTQEGVSFVVESQIHVRRVREGWHDTLRGIHVSFVPGVSILNDTGGLNYDEVYGDTQLNCPVEEISVGESTICTVVFKEEHRTWVTDSYWRVGGMSLGMWPSQTRTSQG
ncbi:PASTA domain-containing protein [Tessaracoccus defluvii]|uniref:PASTA domain-containing protein n=1 Tax=Tessaracoccus defluvii TaxID=1285901 RepID=UPI0029FEFA4F|nr:PASTA domain-containing protein [Tessaracoccus defluvii]